MAVGGALTSAALHLAQGLPPGDDPGWPRGLHDPHICAALTLIHAQPARVWSVESLAQRVGMSRSLFARRFKSLVGRGPIKCLADWRMVEATGHLNDDVLSIEEIGKVAGCDSVAAFGKTQDETTVELPQGARLQQMHDGNSSLFDVTASLAQCGPCSQLPFRSASRSGLNRSISTSPRGVFPAARFAIPLQLYSASGIATGSVAGPGPTDSVCP